MELRPLWDWVLVERDAPETETNEGLIIPDKSVVQSTKCTVITMGALVKEFLPGDEVVIGQYEGIDLRLQDGRKMTLVSPREILCRLETRE